MNKTILALIICFASFAYAENAPTATPSAAPKVLKKSSSASPKTKPSEKQVLQKITFDGILSDDKTQIIGFAKKAGDSDAEFVEEELLIHSASFNKDMFETLLADSIPGAKIR